MSNTTTAAPAAPAVHLVREGKKKAVKLPSIRELVAIAAELARAGVDRADIPALVGRIVDDAIDFDAAINGVAEPIGDALEAADGPLVTALVRVALVAIPGKRLLKIGFAA